MVGGGLEEREWRMCMEVEACPMGVSPDGRGHQRRLMATLALTGSVFVAEVVGAIVTGSLALLVDAGHMLTDMSGWRRRRSPRC